MKHYHNRIRVGTCSKILSVLDSEKVLFDKSFFMASGAGATILS